MTENPKLVAGQKVNFSQRYQPLLRRYLVFRGSLACLDSLKLSANLLAILGFANLMLVRFVSRVKIYQDAIEILRYTGLKIQHYSV